MESNITMEDLEKMVEEAFSKRKPDISITETENSFSALLGEDGRVMARTGIGGLAMYLKAFNGGTEWARMTLLVEYNGTILNNEQRDELFTKVLENGK